MLLVVGLGNPGPEYEKNRHNIGFMAVDAIVRRHGLGPYRAKFQGLLADGQMAGGRLLALKPGTFMNASGRAVAEAARFFKIGAEDVLVLHDELDLEAGKIRTKRGGGHAGHNGLRDIHAHLGPGYGRLRFGIGHPGDKAQVTGHVLKDFSKSDQAWVEPLLDAVAEHFALLAAGRDGDFTTQVALTLRPPERKPKPEGPDEGGADGGSGADGGNGG